MSRIVKRTAAFMSTGFMLSTFSLVLTVNSNSGYSILGNTKVSANINNDVTENLTSQDQQNLENSINQSSNLDVSTMDNSERATFEKLIQNSVDQMKLPSVADTQDAEKKILGFFDSTIRKRIIVILNGGNVI